MIVKVLRIFPVLLYLFILFSPAAARDAEDTGWPVEERCVGEPTKPPEGWTFPGAILMTGHYGIHAISADFQKPYVVAFIYPPTLYGIKSESPYKSAFPPDKQWIVRLEGNYVDTTPEYSHYGTGIYYITGVRVYSTGLPRMSYFIPWYSESAYRGGLHPTPLPEPMWIDSETIAFEGKRVYPFTGEVSEGDYFEQVYYTNVQGIDEADYPSPDWTRLIYVVSLYNFEGVVYGWIESRGDAAQVIQSPLELSLGAVVEWTPDSAFFSTTIAASGQDSADDFPPERLALFDRNGNQRDIIFDAQTDRSAEPRLSALKRWSTDGRYLAFSILNRKDTIFKRHLYIADRKLRRIIDTCLLVDENLAWSPDGTKLAMMDFYDYKRQRPVMVLDMERWELYTVTYHDGDVIGWRGD
jgi:hypothetical protein